MGGRGGEWRKAAVLFDVLDLDLDFGKNLESGRERPSSPCNPIKYKFREFGFGFGSVSNYHHRIN